MSEINQQFTLDYMDLLGYAKANAHINENQYWAQITAEYKRMFDLYTPYDMIYADKLVELMDDIEKIWRAENDKTE